MHKIFYSLVLFVCCISCKSNSAQNVKTLEVAVYKKQIESKKDIQIVDVRTKEEYDSGHLANAINIDYDASDFKNKILALNKSTPTYVYCLAGSRSASAIDIMAKNGFTEIYNMKGGINKWRAKKFPLQMSGTASTAKGEMTNMTMDDFNLLCKGPTPVLFDFSSEHCIPCKQLAPILKEVEEEYAGKIIIIPIDIEKNRTLTNDINITSVPYLIYYVNGKLTMNIEGLTDKKNLVKALGLKK